MPPKKKTNKPNEEPTDKNAVKEEKPIHPPAPQTKPQPKKEEPKPQTKIAPQIISPPQTQPIKVENIVSAAQSQEPKAKKIELQPLAVRSPQDILQDRRKKFGGEEYTSQQKLQQIKQERLKKFGTPGLVEEPETLEKRKQKFGNVGGAAEDEEVIKKRLQKFSNVAEQEDKEVIEARRKKFGQNEEIVDLDEEIKKSKGIKKQEKQHYKPHHHEGKGDRRNFHRR